MPKIKVNRCQYHYEIYGSGPETLLLSHGLLWNGQMFCKQVDHLRDRYKIVTYDHRGQGQSEVTRDGYDMDALYNDAVGIIESLKLGPVHFGGLSMGGFVGMRLAARRTDLVKSLILMETSALAEPNKLKYGLLNTIVKLFGVESVVNPVMKIMFGHSFLNDPQRQKEKTQWANELRKNNKTIVRAVSGVISRKAVDHELKRIKCPTLILVGTEDIATTPEKAEFIHRHIENSTLKYVERGGHTGSIEEPEQYNREIQQFLDAVTNN